MPTINVRLSSKIPAVTALVSARLASAIEKAATDIEAHAKAQAPVDTGYLKGAIEAKKQSPLAWRVESPADYSLYQEYGTHKMGAHPFMTPAAETVRPSLEMALRNLA